MIRWNLFLEVEKVEQLALIDRLATHHDRPPSLKASGKRNHHSSIFTRPFSTGSTPSGHRMHPNPAAQQSPARRVLFSGHVCETEAICLRWIPTCDRRPVRSGTRVSAVAVSG
jgi:hypothetical protein